MQKKGHRAAQEDRARLYLVSAVLYLALITIISHLPGSVLSGLTHRIYDKALHVIEFFPLGLLLTSWLALKIGSRGRGVVLASALALIAVLGLLDEAHQLLVPGRFACWGDVVADLIGGSLGTIIVIVRLPVWLGRTTPAQY